MGNFKASIYNMSSVHALADAMDTSTKDVLETCKAYEIEVKVCFILTRAHVPPLLFLVHAAAMPVFVRSTRKHAVPMQARCPPAVKEAILEDDVLGKGGNAVCLRCACHELKYMPMETRPWTGPVRAMHNVQQHDTSLRTCSICSMQACKPLLACPCRHCVWHGCHLERLECIPAAAS